MIRRAQFLLLLALLPACTPEGGRHQVSGQIEGTAVHAGSLVGGRVVEVLVAEGAAVEAGAVIVRLDPDSETARVAAAAAQVAQAEALYNKLRNGPRPEEIQRARAGALQAEEQLRMLQRGARTEEVEAARAHATMLRAQADQAREDLARMDQLLQGAAVPRQRYDAAKHGYDAAKSALQAAEEELALVTAGARIEEINVAHAASEKAASLLEELVNGARAEDLAAAAAQWEGAKAQLALARKNLQEMEIRAPMDGVVESLDVHPGDLVKPGPIVQLTDPNDLEVILYVSAGLLGALQRGQTIRFTADAFGEESFQGKITQIATAGEYTPRNLQTLEERVQQVFGITVSLDPAGGRLKAGMTVTAHFDDSTAP